MAGSGYRPGSGGTPPHLNTVQVLPSDRSRSAFFATAAEQYLAQLDALDVTKRIDAVLADGDIDPADRVFVDYNTARLAAEIW